MLRARRAAQGSLTSAAGRLAAPRAERAAKRRRLAERAVEGGRPWRRDTRLQTVEAIGAPDVFLAGWHGHDELPNFLRAADVLVIPSVREQFGQVIVEAMACERPAIGVARYGPAEIIDDGQTGWLVEPDDEAVLADALVEAVNRPDERMRRGRRAGEVARGRYAWSRVGERMASILMEAAAG